MDPNSITSSNKSIYSTSYVVVLKNSCNLFQNFSNSEIILRVLFNDRYPRSVRCTSLNVIAVNCASVFLLSSVFIVQFGLRCLSRYILYFGVMLMFMYMYMFLIPCIITQHIPALAAGLIACSHRLDCDCIIHSVLFILFVCIEFLVQYHQV